jgi:hypothetical protein
LFLSQNSTPSNYKHEAKAATYNKGAKALNIDDWPVDPDNLKGGKIQVDMAVFDGRDLDKQRDGSQEQVNNVFPALEKLHRHGQAHQESNDNIHRERNCKSELDSTY